MPRIQFAMLFAWTILFAMRPSIAEEAIDNPAGNTPPPVIAASPARLTLEIGEKPANGSVRLFNLGDQPVTVATSVAHWDLDKSNEVQVIPPTPQSLDQWLIINPVQFTIPPKKSQTIRLSVRPRTKPSPGEHRGIIFFDQQLAPDTPEKTVQIKFKLGVIVYGLAGDIVRKGKLNSISVTQKQNTEEIAFDISSSGNAGIRIDGQYSIWPKSKFPGTGKVPIYKLEGKQTDVPDTVIAGKVTSVPVLAGTHRIVRQPVAMPTKAGEYILLVKGKLGDTAFDKTFNISKK